METPRLIRYADVVVRVGISSAALAAIRAHSAVDPDREVCGLLLGQEGHIEAARPVANIAADPVRRFEIDAVDLFAAIRAERAGGAKLLGYYHSHPNGSAELSATDRELAAGDGKLWLIVAGGEVRAWRAGAKGFDPVQLCSDSPIRPG